MTEEEMRLKSALHQEKETKLSERIKDLEKQLEKFGVNVHGREAVKPMSFASFFAGLKFGGGGGDKKKEKDNDEDGSDDEGENRGGLFSRRSERRASFGRAAQQRVSFGKGEAALGVVGRRNVAVAHLRVRFM